MSGLWIIGKLERGTSTMKAPQIIFIVLYGASLLLHAKNHGKPKEGNENFWITFLSVSIVVGLLIWGGFFN